MEVDKVKIYDYIKNMKLNSIEGLTISRTSYSFYFDKERNQIMNHSSSNFIYFKDLERIFSKDEMGFLLLTCVEVYYEIYVKKSKKDINQIINKIKQKNEKLDESYLNKIMKKKHEIVEKYEKENPIKGLW